MTVPQARNGFTLFEVGLSIALVAMGVLVMALFLPTALKAQGKARFSLYANAKAMEVMEYFHNQPNLNMGTSYHLEATKPWETTAGYKSFTPDIEVKAAAVRGPLFPLPTTIAQRLDSSNNEIQRILDSGGQLYYSNPAAATGARLDSALEPQPPNESIRLVMGIVGAPQQNALAHFWWKGWPYYGAYPGPPERWNTNNSLSNPFKTGLQSWNDDPDLAYLWEFDFAKSGSGSWDFDGTASGSSISGIQQYLASGSTTYTQAGSNFTVDGRGWLLAKCNYTLALWYGWRKNLPTPLLFGYATEADIKAAHLNPEWVLAMRYISYTATALTKWYALDPLPAVAGYSDPAFKPSQYGSTRPFIAESIPARKGLYLGVPIPGDEDPATTTGRTLPSPNTLEELLSVLPGRIPPSPIAPLDPFLSANLPPPPAGDPTPLPGNLYVTHAMIVNYHENALKLAMRFQANGSYDWRIPRPKQRALMVDHPLIQYDLIDSPSYPPIGGTSGELMRDVTGDARIDASVKSWTAKQWRAISAQPLINIGNSAYFLPVNWGAIQGDQSHFNLCQKFNGAERARELVFWEVDWTSYKDFETAPSAPVDASRYPRMRYEFASTQSLTYDIMGKPLSQKGKMDNWTTLWFESYQMSTRNPEKNRLYIKVMDDMATGSNILWWRVPPDNSHDQSQEEKGYFKHSARSWAYDPADRSYDRTMVNYSDGDPISDPKAIFSGIYGGDRNANQRLDRGPIPPSVRMTAREVARFIVYDPRLTVVTR